jgi:hypothetical protein
MNEKVYSVAADEYNAIAKIKAQLMSSNVVTIGGADEEAHAIDRATKMSLVAYEVIITIRPITK